MRLGVRQLWDVLRNILEMPYLLTDIRQPLRDLAHLSAYGRRRVAFRLAAELTLAACGTRVKPWRQSSVELTELFFFLERLLQNGLGLFTLR